MNTIKSVAEYLEYLGTVERIANTTYTVSCTTLFRGQANAEWTLSPSLYRQGLFEAENLLLTEIKHVCPREFTGNRFDFLVKMQHLNQLHKNLTLKLLIMLKLYFSSFFLLYKQFYNSLTYFLSI